jgi:hypothetical protein
VKNYTAYLTNRKTFVAAATISIRADGYLTALQEAQRICTANHPTLYVASVKEE